MKDYDDPDSFTDFDIELDIDRDIDRLSGDSEFSTQARPGASEPSVKYPFPNPPRIKSTPDSTDRALPEPAGTTRARRGYRDLAEIDATLARTEKADTSGLEQLPRRGRGRPRKNPGTDAGSLEVKPKYPSQLPKTHPPDYEAGAEKVKALISQLNPQFSSTAFEAVIKGLLHKPDGSAELKLLIPHEQIPNILCLAFASDLILTVQLQKKHL